MIKKKTKNLTNAAAILTAGVALSGVAAAAGGYGYNNACAANKMQDKAQNMGDRYGNLCNPCGPQNMKDKAQDMGNHSGNMCNPCGPQNMKDKAKEMGNKRYNPCSPY